MDDRNTVGLLHFVFLLSVFLAFSSQPQVGRAQPATSIIATTGQGSLGTMINSGGNVYNITGGERPGNGTNLFHSFGDFSVGVGDTANFLNTPIAGILPPTTNILARVTGGNISNIFGTIQTTGFGSADLFLMNPAGFLFGPTASINIGGMVAFTSADYMKLADSGRFNANPNTTPADILNAAPVATFGFLGSNPGAITVQGSQLTLREGTGITLIGGNITIGSDPSTRTPAVFSTPSGLINLVSVASPGEVLFPSLQTEPNINGQSFSAMGDIKLSDGSQLKVSTLTDPAGNPLSDLGSGTIRIRSGQLVMDNASLAANTFGTLDGAPIAVDIQVTDDLSISDTHGASAITARATGLGDAGEVRITSTNLEATSNVRSLFSPVDTHFALIDTHTSGNGKAGNVNIATNGNLDVMGQQTGPMFFIDSGTIGPDSGHGGDITIAATNITLNSVQINSGDFIARALSNEAGGSGGNVTIAADTLNMSSALIATDGFFVGRAGDLTISARDIQMTNFSHLTLLEFQGGGKLTINATRLLADSTQFELEMVSGRAEE